MLKIARIGTMNQEIPPPKYGGTQRSMAQMTAFQATTRGHDITIYAPEGSKIIEYTRQVAEELGLKFNKNDNYISITNKDGSQGSVTLRTTGHKALGYGAPDAKQRNRELTDLLIEDEKLTPSDLIHVHAKGRIPELAEAGLFNKVIAHEHDDSLLTSGQYAHYKYPVIAISENQAQSFRDDYNANIVGVAYHGLDSFTIAPTTESAGYLASIGRLLEEKGPHRAIDIARRAGKPLIIAGTTNDNTEMERYCEEKLMPHVTVHDETFLDQMKGKSAADIKEEIARLQQKAGKEDIVIFTGPANEEQKKTLFGNADATLFPISWAEPFGRVMIESMAAGTPVIGYTKLGNIGTGSVNEVIDDGLTGFKVQGRTEEEAIENAASAVARIPEIDRACVRQTFNQKWTSERNAERLDELYETFRLQQENKYKTKAEYSTNNHLKKLRM